MLAAREAANNYVRASDAQRNAMNIIGIKIGSVNL